MNITHDAKGGGEVWACLNVSNFSSKAFGRPVQWGLYKDGVQPSPCEHNSEDLWKQY